VVALALGALGAFSLWGADNQEASQVTAAVSIGSYCLMYLLLFGAVIFGFRANDAKPGAAIRLTSLAGFLVSLCALFFEVVPLGDVASPVRFALKVAGAIAVTNGVGAILYFRSLRRARSLRASQSALS